MWQTQAIPVGPARRARVGAPSDKPSPWIAAASSFVMFAIGALLPYLVGSASLWLGRLACGGVGLLIGASVS